MRAIDAGFVVVVALAGAVGCGGGAATPSAPAPTGPVTINIIGEKGDQSFSPNPAMAAGRTVVFRNTDSVVHRVRLNDLSIDTGDIAPGATSREVIMPPAGAHYHCFLHLTMVGAVAREGSGPPPCQGDYC